jgi:hypothetical protein
MTTKTTFIPATPEWYVAVPIWGDGGVQSDSITIQFLPGPSPKIVTMRTLDDQMTPTQPSIASANRGDPQARKWRPLDCR